MSAPQATVPELTVNVTEFKAKCLSLMSRLAAGDYARINVVKRGKTLAIVNAPQPDAVDFDEDAWRRDLQASSGWIPEGYDGTQPTMTDKEADQLQERMIQKITRAPRDPENVWS